MKVLYIDMDGVLADFGKAIENHPLRTLSPYDNEPDLIPGIFMNLEPLKGAIESVEQLIDSQRFDIYILTTAPWGNPEAWMHKRLWIEKYFGGKLKKKLIISHHKNLLKGDYLIDDRTARGAAEFGGEHLHFGWDYINKKWNRFPDWESILKHLF